ncbi:synaptogenesis protein syg-2 [Contarinia nasturtii]|uniref:synaptogenesis protein syg-2 n=1 Tax=Contarinia nasturtii TaxID=265458 RepID=UPI0012D4BC86|nr:synaptogenesis protein syg-2 [Contarinia nasturtii]XP_031621518.1 synaptogenesis protein syg-2 [Contarinia nasturtii]
MDTFTSLIVIALFSFVTQITLTMANGYKMDATTQRAFENTGSHIKCDVSTRLPNDQVLLVVWYKNNLPIYSYDTRTSSVPSHWSDPNIMGNRTIFRIARREPAELIIKQVKAEDTGEFRCRVDFKLSPTRNSVVNLEVVVPPQKPKIMNDRGEIIQSIAGPYDEGTDCILLCEVRGGSPPPTIKWLWNGKQLDSTMLDFSFTNAQTSKIVIKNLSRIHQRSVITCRASNFPKTEITANITIDLLLRPLTVDILLNNQPLSADRKYEIECQAIGSKPSAKITWSMNGIQLRSYSEKASDNGNVSISILSFTPTREDNGKVLICRAVNEVMKHNIKETTLKLNIYFVPIIRLSLGSNLNPDDIEEGDDVYWECKVHANPPAYKVVWKHNNQIVQHNPKVGVIASSSDLALQSVQVHQAGNYSCIASNVEGDGESNTLELNVMFRPLCRNDQKRIYGVARNEMAQILCEVDAYPAPTSFKWSFNNTAETIDMPQNGFEKHSRTSSRLSYTPVKEMDYGTLMCWADNAVGQQKEPCVFHIIAAGKPDSPYNCTLVNQTSEGLEVDCNEGFDGGQRQWFRMEIIDQQTGILIANLSSFQPEFDVRGLDSERLLRISVMAINARGVSDSVILEAQTLKAAEKRMGPNAQFELTPVLSIGIFIGVLTALVCIAFGTALALKLRTTEQLRRRRLHQPNDSQFDKPFSTRPGNLPIKDKISLPLGVGDLDDVYDDKNPDVVPYNEDLDCKLKSAVQTPAAMHNNLHNNVPEILGRSNVNSSQMYYKTQAPSQSQVNQSGAVDELHYAELAISRNSATGSGISLSKQTASSAPPPPPLPSSSTGNYDIKYTDTKNTLPNKPPAYDYFKEPTVYAQIDHFKTMQHKSHAPSSSSMMINSASASNAYQLHHQNATQTHQSNQYYQQQAQPHPQLQYGSDCSYSMRNNSNNSMGSGSGAALNNSASNGTLSNSNTLTFSNQSIQSPSSSSTVYYSGNQAQASQQSQHALTTNTSKQYSREIVTIRTPLLCSQQESCV